MKVYSTYLFFFTTRFLTLFCTYSVFLKLFLYYLEIYKDQDTKVQITSQYWDLKINLLAFAGNSQHQIPNIYELSSLLLNGKCLLKGKSGYGKGQNKLCLAMAPLG